jgi:hypothetical protein
MEDGVLEFNRVIDDAFTGSSGSELPELVRMTEEGSPTQSP